MIKLVIEKIDRYIYRLKDENNNIHEFYIEFYDLLNKPNVNDYLFVNEKLLSAKNSLLSFGLVNSTYGKNINSIDDIDLVVLINNNEKIYLKRLYG